MTRRRAERRLPRDTAGLVGGECALLIDDPLDALPLQVFQDEEFELAEIDQVIAAKQVRIAGAGARDERRRDYGFSVHARD